MARLTLDGVTKVFDDGGEGVVAVEDLSVEIRDGELLVLVGPSGCGKSTTLRMIAGLESVTSGQIRIGDTLVNDVPPADRNIAMVFQSYALYPHMSVRQNMSFGLEESSDLEEATIRETVAETARMMDIEDLLDRKPSDLSGGQQQRVALGRAIVRDPEVFLMDEPLSNLDAKLRATMRTELQRIQSDLGVTTVYVTHDQTEAMTMGDRIAVLNDGVLQQIGTPLECYHTPNNRFVAGFIGEPSMNFFDVTNDDGVLRGDSFSYPLPAAAREAVGDATALTLGVRPEDVTFRPHTTGAGDHGFECVVDVVEPVGDTNNLFLRFETDDGETAQTFAVTVGGTTDVESGDRGVARVPPEVIHLFDARDGRALKNRETTEVESITAD